MELEIKDLNCEIIILDDDFSIEIGGESIEINPEKEISIEDTVKEFISNNIESFLVPLIPKPIKGKDGKDGESIKGEDGNTPIKGVDYFTKKEVSEIKKALKDTILSELPKIITEEEINVKLEDVLKKIPKENKIEKGATFLRQLLDVKMENLDNIQYGFTYNKSTAQFTLNAISAGGDRYKTTSTTSNTIAPNGSLTFTVDTGLAYISQQDVIIAHDASNHMHGAITSYNDITGIMIVDIQHKTGSGTFSSWDINLDGIDPGIPTLQQVTDVGSTTTNDIEANSFITTGGVNTQVVAGDGSLIPLSDILPTNQITNVIRSGGYIASYDLNGVTYTVTRTGNYISSIDNGTTTWTVARDADNYITSVTN